mgnify:CR=1 FL=1
MNLRFREHLFFQCFTKFRGATLGKKGKENFDNP